jgi:hypothetical protein
LPEPLRVTDVNDNSAVEPADQDDGGEAIPAFLNDDSDEEDLADIDEDEESMIAAE